jgi:hypothetical protein
MEVDSALVKAQALGDQWQQTRETIFKRVEPSHARAPSVSDVRTGFATEL